MSLLLLPTIRASRRRFLPETLAYAAASGATDLGPLNSLFGYVISESLWNNFRIYVGKGAQNANAGSTVFGAGALTANNMTLIGSPTWGADGITYNGTSQAGEIAKFINQPVTTTVWTRHAYISLVGAAVNTLWSTSDFSGSLRSLRVGVANNLTGDPYIMFRSGDGSASPNAETYRETTSTYSTSEQTHIDQHISGGGRAMWINNTSTALTLELGTAQTSAFNAATPLVLAGTYASGVISPQSNVRVAAQAFLVGPTPTTTQRETITDLVNAL
jgi:hypothetical protein